MLWASLVELPCAKLVILGCCKSTVILHRIRSTIDGIRLTIRAYGSSVQAPCRSLVHATPHLTGTHSAS